MLEIQINPCGKPRMTRSDRWRMRPAVLKYRAFADRLRSQFGRRKFPIPFSCVFVIPMPKSWSEKKRVMFDGAPHQQKPDLDNLIKSVWDTLLDDDSLVHTIVECRKEWGREGRIVFPGIK